MNRLFVYLFAVVFILQSCVVTTTAKVVGAAANIGYKTVKGTVKGIGRAVDKAKGKIDPENLDGNWKIVGSYDGSYEEFLTDGEDKGIIENSLCAQTEIEFNAKRKKFKQAHCAGEDEDWIDYKLKYGKNPISKERENFIQYNGSNVITVINANRKTLILEGNLMLGRGSNGNKLYFLEKD